MARTFCLLVLLTVSVSAFGQIPGMDSLKESGAMDSLKQAAGGSMSALLENQLDISEDQAEGSIGSLLSLASEKLNAGDFDKLAGMIPGADKYMDTAKSLGAVTGPLKNLDGLTQSLSSLGISSETIEKFIPTIKDYLGKLGGDEAMALLNQVLG